MERTPDPKSAKRGRSEETDTPITRRRTTSPDQEFQTPVWRKDQVEQQPRGEKSPIGVSDLGSLEEGEVGEKLNWSKTMEEEELSTNLSVVPQHSEPFSDNTTGTDGTETVDDGMINRMINKTLSLRDSKEQALAGNPSGERYNPVNEEGVMGTFPGVKQLLSELEGNLSQNQLITLIQQTISKAVKEAINPIMEEMRDMRKQLLEGKEATHQGIIPTPVWPILRNRESLPIPSQENPTEQERAFGLARKCVGLGPISSDTVNQHAEASSPDLDNHTRDQLGGAFAVRDFLCKEMGVTDYEADNIRIVRTFRLQEHKDTLFAEFGNEGHLKKIRSKAPNLSNGKDDDPKLTTFIPKQLQAQHARLVARANKGRAQIPRKSSKIWLGANGFELRFRPKDNYTPWNKIQPESEVDPNSFSSRQTLIKEREQLLINPKPSPRTTNDTWLFQNAKKTPTSPVTNHTDNPNLIPVAKNRVRGNLMGNTLLPRGIINTNRFDHFRAPGSSP